MDSSLISVLLVIGFIFEWGLRILALFVVPRNRRSNSGMSWMLFIALVPVVGWAVFLFLGSSKLPKNRRDAQASLDRYIVQTTRQVNERWKEATHLVSAVPPKKYTNSVNLSTALTHLLLFGGNTIKPIADYNDVIRQIVHDIDKARRHVLIEYYALALDDATESLFVALETAAARGVTVRVLYDAFGSRKYSRKDEMLARLKQAGIEVHAMLPMHFPGKKYTRPDLRNHRKLVVVDGKVGYTGSLNMVQRDYHRKDDIVYDELVVRIEGPVTAQIEAVFLNDWLAETGQFLADEPGDIVDQLRPKGGSLAHVVPSGPGYDYENNRKFFTSLFYAAEQEIIIVNPYFVPDDSLITALISAAMRGVRVVLLNSEAIDQVMVAHAQRSYYEQMLEAGVEIYLYNKPALLHSKYAIIDQDACFVGSSNMDIRSFELNQELTLTVYDEAFVAAMRTITADYLKNSHRVKKDEWLRRPPRKKLLDNIARLTSSLQ